MKSDYTEMFQFLMWSRVLSSPETITILTKTKYGVSTDCVFELRKHVTEEECWPKKRGHNNNRWVKQSVAYGLLNKQGTTFTEKSPDVFIADNALFTMIILFLLYT